MTDAEIEPVVRRPRWLSKQEFMNGVLAHQADAALTGELTALLLDHPRADPT